jgi:hypothetical protein
MPEAAQVGARRTYGWPRIHRQARSSRLLVTDVAQRVAMRIRSGRSERDDVPHCGETRAGIQSHGIPAVRFWIARDPTATADRRPAPLRRRLQPCWIAPSLREQNWAELGRYR